jgi:hypothetical protein
MRERERERALCVRGSGVDARTSEPFLFFWDIIFKIFVNKMSVSVCFRVTSWLNITDT